MTLIYYAYLHARPDGSIFYVGKGSGERAWNFYRSRHHRKIIMECGGLKAIKVSLIYAETEAKAFATEREWIAFLRSSGVRLINLTEGGEGVPLTPDIIKRRATTLNKTNLLPEVRWRRSKAARAKYDDPEYRARQATTMAITARRSDVLPRKRAALERVRADPEAQRRRLKSMKVAFSKDEYREKKRQISLAKGNKPPTYQGGEHPMAKRVICIETGESFLTVRLAIAWLKSRGLLKASPSAIVSVCRGRQRSAYNFHWKYTP
jgi:hypothetical protein